MVRKKILITNDDGYTSEGLKALIEAVSDLGDITVVAPASEKSACGHSLTITRPLRFISIDDDFYKLDDGTPSDCIYLALNSLFEFSKPDIILSGINRGSNMGEDITYSGTASAAMEGVLHGVSSIAFSQVIDGGCDSDYSLAKTVVRDLTTRVLNNGFPVGDRVFLNVNIPINTKFQGYKITNVGYRIYANDAHLHKNPRGEEYYWLGLHPLVWESRGELCDFDAIKDGFVSISPIKLDMSDYDSIEKLKKWI